MTEQATSANRYHLLVEKVFFDHYKEGLDEILFERDEIIRAASKLGLPRPKNIGDVIYAVRYRIGLPEAVAATQPEGMGWIIEGAGRAKYRMRLAPLTRILPNENLIPIKIPDSTPEIISRYALTDEQALLAKIRYNRLLDIFLGIATYSLQNHLRTSVKATGQVEIDEIYVGIDRHGCQYVIPVQAKGGGDQLSVVQTRQDINCCAEKFPDLVCRAISTQFMSSELIAVFEVAVEAGELGIVSEKHYRLVASRKISRRDLKRYAERRGLP